MRPICPDPDQTRRQIAPHLVGDPLPVPVSHSLSAYPARYRGSRPRRRTYRRSDWLGASCLKGSTTNICIDTAATKPGFRSAFKARRCLIPLAGDSSNVIADQHDRKPICLAQSASWQFVTRPRLPRIHSPCAPPRTLRSSQGSAKSPSTSKRGFVFFSLKAVNLDLIERGAMNVLSEVGDVLERQTGDALSTVAFQTHVTGNATFWQSRYSIARWCA